MMIPAAAINGVVVAFIVIGFFFYLHFRTKPREVMIKAITWVVVGIGAVALVLALVWGGKRLRQVMLGTKTQGTVAQSEFKPNRADTRDKR
jgi:hypothetical protein